TSITFDLPPHPDGKTFFTVYDAFTGQRGNLVRFNDDPRDSFEYVATPAIGRVVPGLTPQLGGETIYVQGANFSASDKVYIETSPGSGSNFDNTGWDEITGPGLQTTFVDDKRHKFRAPVKLKGAYRV